MKVVAIEKELAHLKGILDSRGYKTVFPEDTNDPVYAFIYYEDSFNIDSMNMNSYSNNVMISSSEYGPGTLLINANGKSPDDIISILERRIYSPLF